MLILILGAFSCGKISDHFNGKRIPVLFAFLIGMIVSLTLVLYSPSLAILSSRPEATFVSSFSPTSDLI